MSNTAQNDNQNAQGLSESNAEQTNPTNQQSGYPMVYPFYPYPQMNMTLSDHHLMSQVYAQQNSIYMAKIAPYLASVQQSAGAAASSPAQVSPPSSGKDSVENTMSNTFGSDDSLFDLTESFFSLDSLLDEPPQSDSLSGGVEITPDNVLSSDIQFFLSGLSGDADSPFLALNSSQQCVQSAGAAAVQASLPVDPSSASSLHQAAKPAPLKIPSRQIARLKEEDRSAGGDVPSPLKRSRRHFEEEMMSPTSAASSAYDSPGIVDFGSVDDDLPVGDEERMRKRRRVQGSGRGSEEDERTPTGDDSSPSNGKALAGNSNGNKSSLMCLGRVKRKRLPKVYDSMVLRFQCM